MRILKTLKNQKGVGLIETLIALGISVAVITALVSLAVFTLRSSTQNKLLLQSSKLVNEELELVRAYRDSVDWATFVGAMQSNNCNTGTCNMSVSPLQVNSGTETIGSGLEQLTRSFQITDPLEVGGSLDGDENLVRVEVTVSWQVGGETRSAYNYTELSSWRSE